MGDNIPEEVKTQNDYIKHYPKRLKLQEQAVTFVKSSRKISLMACYQGKRTQIFLK